MVKIVKIVYLHVQTIHAKMEALVKQMEIPSLVFVLNIILEQIVKHVTQFFLKFLIKNKQVYRFSNVIIFKNYY